MNSCTRWAVQALLAISAVLPCQLAAAPVDRAFAEVMVKGWIEEARPHLSLKFHATIDSTETFAGFHVVRLKPDGFVITADDDELEPVIAFSDRGDFVDGPENPLSILLRRDIPARKEQLKLVKSKRSNAVLGKNPGAVGLTLIESEVVSAAEQATEKWRTYKEQGTRSDAKGGGAQQPGDVDWPGASPLALPPRIQIRSISVADGHIRLTHDGRSSVSVYASYDNGLTWQLVDSGVVWPEWTAKRPAQEASCWYRLEADQVYDEMAVDLMRHPPPDGRELEAAPLEFVSQPTNEVGLAASKGTLSDIHVAPLVQSSWSQGGVNGVNCYNYYTPNNYVDGCVATALAQLMRYWQHPTAGIGQVTRTVYVNGTGRSATTRGGNGAGGAYNWGSMPLNPASVPYNASQWQMIGSLCYDAGVSVNMQYASGGSGAYMHLCASALSTVFQYANAKYLTRPANYLTPINSNLAAGYPVLLGISSSGGSGHAVVCDGFGYDAGTLYHHINMGWAGSYNYWYAMPNLETSYNFNSIDTVVFNIYPTGVGELLTGRVKTSQGAPVPGVAVTASAGGQNFSGTTDAKGYYGIKVPSGQTYSVAASKAGMGNSTRSGVVVGTTSTGASGNVTGVDFTLNNTFSFTAVGLTNNVWLRWSDPTSSGLPNKTVYIRHRTDAFPGSSSDGTLVYSGTAQSYEHSGVDVSGTGTNYYTIWGDSGGGYVSLGGTANRSTVADPGTTRLFWTGSSGEVCSWNLKANGAKKSGANAVPGLVNPSYWKIAGCNDIDGDKISDLLWVGNGGEVAFWLLNADGTQRAAGPVAAGNQTKSGYWSVGGFNDINGDGSADILWTGAGGEVAYWLLNANGTQKSGGLVASKKLASPTYWRVVGFADINGDGTSDILWTGSGGEVSYWFLNADGTQKGGGYPLPGNVTKSGYWACVGLRDINGDGCADVLWTGSGGEVNYWLMNANGTIKTAGPVKTGNVTRSGYWKVKGFQDISRDGIPDIIWCGQGGETSCWFLKADGTVNTMAAIDTVAVSPSYWTIRAVGRSGP